MDGDWFRGFTVGPPPGWSGQFGPTPLWCGGGRRMANALASTLPTGLASFEPGEQKRAAHRADGLRSSCGLRCRCAGPPTGTGLQALETRLFGGVPRTNVGGHPNLE
jgi:hypothetical protein